MPRRSAQSPGWVAPLRLTATATSICSARMASIFMARMPKATAMPFLTTAWPTALPVLHWRSIALAKSMCLTVWTKHRMVP
jgi:hypothetical protein